MADFLRLWPLAIQAPAFWSLVATMLLEYGLTFFLQRRLLLRMSEVRRAQSWNPLTWSTAILWAGALSMIPFAWVTRDGAGVRSGVVALFSGLLWSALLFGGLLLVGDRLSWLLGLGVS